MNVVEDRFSLIVFSSGCRRISHKGLEKSLAILKLLLTSIPGGMFLQTAWFDNSRSKSSLWWIHELEQPVLRDSPYAQ